MPDPNNVVLPGHGIAWHGIEKNANTSIKRAFLSSLGVAAPDPHDLTALNYVSNEEIASCGLWRFAIVRDPYARLASCWRDKCFEGWDNASGDWGLWPSMPFADFVDRVCRCPDSDAIEWGRHWRSQAATLLTAGCPVLPDYVGHYETLTQAWSLVQAKSLIPLPALRHENASTARLVPWTPELRQRVAERYRRDFDLFGYSEVR